MPAEPAFHGLLEAFYLAAGGRVVRAGTIVSVALPRIDPARVMDVLSERGIVATARDGKLRLSIHFYNHEDDIDRLRAALKIVS